MTDFSAERVRAETRNMYARMDFAQLGLGPPLLEIEALTLRDAGSMFGRSLAIFGALCVAYEPKETTAQASAEVSSWLTRHRLDVSLTDAERRVVRNTASKGDLENVEPEVESLFALAWCLGLVDDLNPAQYVPDSFGQIFPNISSGSNPDVLLNDIRIRPHAEIVQQLDYYYCLHWSIRESQSKTSPLVVPVQPYVIRYRRHALEWALSAERWDEISLDT